MQDQAARLRELVEAEAVNNARSISITSGKGGVGKTNIVINLAIALAKQKKRVVILDADLGLANVDVLLNINPKYNLYHFLERHKRLDDIIVEGPLGIRIIPGASGIARLANLTHNERYQIIDELNRLQADADFILIDTSAGISKNVLSFLSASDLVILVTTPEPTAITDAYAVIKVLAQQAPLLDARLVLNMITSYKEADQIYNRIAMVAKQFLHINIKKAGYIIKDDGIVQSVLTRKPFILEYPYAPASKMITNIAKELISEFEQEPVSSQGWLGRLLNIWGKG